MDFHTYIYNHLHAIKSSHNKTCCQVYGFTTELKRSPQNTILMEGTPSGEENLRKYTIMIVLISSWAGFVLQTWLPCYFITICCLLLISEGRLGPINGDAWSDFSLVLKMCRGLCSTCLPEQALIIIGHAIQSRWTNQTKYNITMCFWSGVLISKTRLTSLTCSWWRRICPWGMLWGGL